MRMEGGHRDALSAVLCWLLRMHGNPAAAHTNIVRRFIVSAPLPIRFQQRLTAESFLGMAD